MQRQSVPVGDERQRRTDQQLLELMGAQDIAVKSGLPYSRPRPGAVQQRGLTHQQSPVLGKKTSSILPVTLLVSNTPELLSAGRRGQKNKLEDSEAWTVFRIVRDTDTESCRARFKVAAAHLSVSQR